MNRLACTLKEQYAQGATHDKAIPACAAFRDAADRWANLKELGYGG